MVKDNKILIAGIIIYLVPLFNLLLLQNKKMPLIRTSLLLGSALISTYFIITKFSKLSNLLKVILIVGLTLILYTIMIFIIVFIGLAVFPW